MKVRYLAPGKWADGLWRPQFDVVEGDEKTIGDRPGEVSFEHAEFAHAAGKAVILQGDASPAAPSESTNDSAPASDSPEDDDPTA